MRSKTAVITTPISVRGPDIKAVPVIRLTEVCSALNISIMKASHHTVSVSIISQRRVLPVPNPKAA